MTLRRILTIIIVLLVLVGLLFGASWYISRRNAEKNGTTPLTFREFLGIGSPAAPGQNVQNEFVSQFTTDTSADTNGNSVPDGEEDLNANGTLDKNDIVISPSGQKTNIFNSSVKGSIDTRAIVFSRFNDTNTNSINDWNEDLNGNGDIDGIEDLDGNDVIDGYGNGSGDGPTIGGEPGQNPDNGGFGNGGGFTSGPITPTDNFPNDSGNPSDGPGTTPSGNTNGPDIEDDGAIDPITPGTAAVENSCSDADTNIDFTQAEIARLNILQNRFYTIAQSLRSDSDVQTELSNYDAFQVKASQALELYNYCQSKLPLITNPALQKRVATPFWRDPAKDSQTFLSPEGDLQGEMSINHSEKSMPTLLRILQNVLHINLW